MKKNQIALLLAAVMLLTLFAGCTKPVEELVDTPVEEPSQEIYFTIDAYTMAGGMLTATQAGENTETGAWGFAAAEGTVIGDVLAEQEITDLDAYLDGDVLEGWMIYEEIITTDEDGFENYSYELRSGDTVYSTEELMELTVPSYNACYVAKWAGLAIEDYFAEEDYMFDADTTTGSFILNAGGGAVMNFQPADGSEAYVSQTYTYWMEDGTTLNDLVATEEWDGVASIEKNGASFTGWTVYEGSSITWSSEESTEENVTSMPYVMNNPSFAGFEYILITDCSVYQENMSTEELYELVNNSTNYYAVANWE